MLVAEEFAASPSDWQAEAEAVLPVAAPSVVPAAPEQQPEALLAAGSAKEAQHGPALPDGCYQESS